MTVQVLAGSVAAHRGARVSVTSGDLDVAQVNTSVETGRDKGLAEHMRMRSGNPDASRLGELVQAAGGRVPVHPGAAAVEQNRPAHVGSGRPLAAAGPGLP